MPLSLTDESGPGGCDLLCSEDAGGILAAEDRPEHPLAAEFPADSDDSIAGFVEGESDYSPGSDYPARFRSRSLDPSAREESVDWILKVHAYYRFRPLTVYLSINYMDRFLSCHRLPQANGWPLQLLAVACLSLAAKMEETLVPSLLDLQVGGARFIFEPRTICKMEFLVLAALNWRLRSVTPFTFIDFFACKADPRRTYARFLVSRATEIVLETLRGIEFLDHCPSSMAAAAIICSADVIPDLAFIEPRTAEKWCIGLTKEGITECYRSMQRVAIDDTGRKPPKIIPQLRVTTLVDMASEASSSYPSPNKRRKLNNKCLWVDDDKEEP